MDSIVLHDYEVAANSEFSSDFLNQVYTDFTNNIVNLFIDYKNLVNDYQKFTLNVQYGLDWLTEVAATLSANEHTVSGYSVPLSSSNMELDKLFGMFYLKPIENSMSIIGRYLSTTGKLTAYESVKTYVSTTGNHDGWVEDRDLRVVVDNHMGIWRNTYTASSITVSINLSNINVLSTNIFEIVPFAGTTISEIRWKNVSGVYERGVVNSAFPYKTVGDFSFSGELQVVLTGVALGDGTYAYSLRYIDIYQATFASEGSVTYNIGDWLTITSISLDSDYPLDDITYPETYRIQLLSEDDSEVYYDSGSDPFPLQSSITIPGGVAVPLHMRVSMTKDAEKTPVIRYVDIT